MKKEIFFVGQSYQKIDAGFKTSSVILAKFLKDPEKFV